MTDRHSHPAVAALRGPAVFAAITLLGCALLLALWRGFAGPLTEEPRVRVGVTAMAGQEPLALARAGGALDPARVTVVEFASCEALRDAFLDGNVHAAVFDLDDALQVCRPPMDARVLRFVATSRAPLLLMTTTAGLDLAGLRGRSIGLESGRRPMAALRELLARAGLALADVELRQLDAGSAALALAHRRVDAALVYPPLSDRLAHAGAHVLARWAPAPPGDLLALVASGRARRYAAGQLEHLASALRSGADWAGHPDPARLALIARRERIETAEAAGGLADVRFLGPAEERRLRSPSGRPALVAHLGAIARRWRALGVVDTVETPECWMLAATEAAP